MVGNRRANTLAAALAALCSITVSISPVAAKRPKPQGLWVGGFRYFSEFQGKALKQSGTPKAKLAFGSADFNAPLSMVFDAHQNLWTVFQSINGPIDPVIELSRGNIASIKARIPTKPKVVISRTGNSTVPFVFPVSVGFDAAGDLWVIDENRKLLKFLPSQIEKSGGPTPNIVITPTGATISKITFDGSDNLWIVASLTPFSFSNPLQMWRLTPSDRAASGPANPSLVVNLPDLNFPVDFVFDSVGNLWFGGAGSQGDQLQMISASDLTGTGEVSPTAAVTITSSAFGLLDGSGSCLGGIDLDHSGDLWVSVGADNADCNSNAQLAEFTPGQLSTGGNLTPSVILGQNARRTNLFIPGPIRFGPTLP